MSRWCPPRAGQGVELGVVDGKVVVTSVADSALGLQGLLHAQDAILSVNGQEVKSPEQVKNLWKRQADHCTLKVLPSAHHPPSATAVPAPATLQKYVRAMFDYEPAADGDLPVRELGLPFSTGDVLQVLSHDDDKYWHARKVNDASAIGLVPSKKMADGRRPSDDGKGKCALASPASRVCARP